MCNASGTLHPKRNQWDSSEVGPKTGLRAKVLNGPIHHSRGGPALQSKSAGASNSYARMRLQTRRQILLVNKEIRGDTVPALQPYIPVGAGLVPALWRRPSPASPPPLLTHTQPSRDFDRTFP